MIAGELLTCLGASFMDGKHLLWRLQSELFIGETRGISCFSPDATSASCEFWGIDDND